ncbi:hypothetical protein FQN50_005599 [Emmonsiellopsis sp. PD_5]|nr:hypothetical protein FQN50_005599 [Emmonsiellopsis sp. PD_5]
MEDKDGKDLRDEEPKIETANFGVKTTPKDMQLLSSSAKAAQDHRKENLEERGTQLLMEAFDKTLGGSGDVSNEKEKGE